jgi:hypothetical protein
MTRSKNIAVGTPDKGQPKEPIAASAAKGTPQPELRPFYVPVNNEKKVFRKPNT